MKVYLAVFALLLFVLCEVPSTSGYKLAHPLRKPVYSRFVRQVKPADDEEEADDEPADTAKPAKGSASASGSASSSSSSSSADEGGDDAAYGPKKTKATTKSTTTTTTTTTTTQKPSTKRPRPGYELINTEVTEAVFRPKPRGRTAFDRK